MRRTGQPADLGEASHHRRRAIGQDEAGAQAGGVLENRHHVLDHEGLTAGEGELPDVQPDGRVHHSGFTATFPPNTRVPFTRNGVEYDIDYNSRQEGNSATVRTFAAITARSYHNGTVNAARLDGSVHAIADGTDPAVWRALATRADGEAVAVQ